MKAALRSLPTGVVGEEEPCKTRKCPPALRLNSLGLIRPIHGVWENGACLRGFLILFPSGPWRPVSVRCPWGQAVCPASCTHRTLRHTRTEARGALFPSKATWDCHSAVLWEVRWVPEPSQLQGEGQLKASVHSVPEPKE